ncbi:MAG TPA: hypothetical protein VK673_21965 [Chthoniobacterales bacterium]|nr:hypothetical protein [Chthoniobacterales bacterium]
MTFRYELSFEFQAENFIHAQRIVEQTALIASDLVQTDAKLFATEEAMVKHWERNPEVRCE